MAGCDTVAQSFQATPEAPIVWQAGMEGGHMGEWYAPGGHRTGGGEFNSDGGESFASMDVAHGGAWSAALVLPGGSGGTRLFRWRESDEHPEAYYAAWFYFPRRYEPDVWWSIFQFKSQLSELVSDPFWVLTVDNRDDGAMYLELGDARTDRAYPQEVADLPVGAWVHIECYLRQSATADGQLKCWQDGQLLWDLEGITTHHPGSTNQWSVNNYSDAVGPAPVVVYVDDASISVPADP